MRAYSSSRTRPGRPVAFGGEAQVVRRLRTLLLEEKGIARKAMRVWAYWKRGVADHHEELG